MLRRGSVFVCRACVMCMALAVSCAGGGAVQTPDAAPTYVPQTPDAEREGPPQPSSGKTAFDYFRDEAIVSGWNLGNTLDSYRNGVGGETIWGNPRVNQNLLNGVREAGFDIVRIPVTWMGYLGGPPDHRISESRLKRVADVVDMAHNAGLKVIINLHHDGSTENWAKEDGWLSIANAAYSEAAYNKITWQFARVWKQIAVYFKNYGDWLMFESFNEIHDGNWGSGNQGAMAPQFEVIKKWNQIFTDVVRSAGGNNETRILVIPGYCTRPIHTLADYFVLPNDGAPGRQAVTFHYYDPYEFCIAGRRPDWGTDAERKQVDDDFMPFKAAFIDKGIPVIIGETGAVRQLYPGDTAREAQARQSRLDYLSHIFAVAKKYGLVPVYWDNGSTAGNGEKFGLFNRASGQANSDESKACIEAMINAVR